MKLPRNTIRCLLCLALLFALRPANAQRGSNSNVDALLSRAARLAEAGDFSAAESILEDARSGCTARDKGCLEKIVGFEASLAERQRAANPGPDQKQALEHSVERFERVLEDAAPARSGPVLENLASLKYKLGESGEAAAYLERAITDDPPRAPQYQASLEDLRLSEGDWAGARDAYRAALQGDPDSQIARQRLVQTYAGDETSSPQDLMPKLEEWEAAYPEVAKDGYAVVIRRGYEDDAQMADQALLRWTRLLAEEGSISPKSLETLPARWESESLAGLREYLNDPQQRPSGGNWWLADLERRIVLARVALAVGGDYQLGKGSPPWSERCWNAGLEIAPEYERYHYEGKSAPLVRLDLHTALYSLYVDHGEDLENAKGERIRIEQQIFSEKAKAYELGDLEAIQRHHSALGILYAELGWWQYQDRRDYPLPSPYRRFAHAFFQLESAIRVARSREDQGVPYQPLATEKSLLAKGYGEKEQLDKAVPQYLEAVQAFLDADLLGEAAKALQALARLPVELSSRQAASRAALEGVLARRRLTEETGERLLAAVRNELNRSDSGDERLTGFQRRQQFKAAADFAISLRGEAAEGTDVRLAPGFGPAVSLASKAVRLVSASTSFNLVGSRDLKRLRQCAGIVDEGLGSELTQILTRLGKVDSDESGYASPKLSVPGALAGSRALIPAEAVLAARIVPALDLQEWLPADVSLRIEGSTIVGGPLDPRSLQARRLKDRIASVDGVGEVVFRPSPI